MTSHPRLTIRGLRVRGVHVPMRRPLQTGGGTVGIAPLALIDLLTEQGVTGSTYLFCYTPLALEPVLQMLTNLVPLIQGDAVAPLALDRKLQKQFRLLVNYEVTSFEGGAAGGKRPDEKVFLTRFQIGW